MKNSLRALICITALVGMVSNPVLAAITCAMQCAEVGNFLQIDETVNGFTHDASTATASENLVTSTLTSDHCAESDSVPAQSSTESFGSPDMDGIGCDCSSSCSNSSVTLPWALSLLGEMFLPLRAMAVADNDVPSFVQSTPYRPPIA